MSADRDRKRFEEFVGSEEDVKPQLRLASRKQCYDAGQSDAAEKLWAELSYELGLQGAGRWECIKEIRRLQALDSSHPNHLDKSSTLWLQSP